MTDAAGRDRQNPDRERALRALVAKWREDANSPISKHARPVDRENMKAIKNETRSCSNELERVLDKFGPQVDTPEVTSNHASAVVFKLRRRKAITSSQAPALYAAICDVLSATAPLLQVEPRALLALQRLRNEVSGILGYAEEEIRAAIGNTNLACLRLRLQEAEAALAAPPSQVEPLCAAPRCDDCGLEYGTDDWLDTVLTREDWLKICPDGSGILCANCIVRRAPKLPGIVGLNAYFYYGNEGEIPHDIGERIAAKFLTDESQAHELKCLIAGEIRKARDRALAGEPLSADAPALTEKDVMKALINSAKTQVAYVEHSHVLHGDFDTRSLTNQLNAKVNSSGTRVAIVGGGGLTAALINKLNEAASPAPSEERLREALAAHIHNMHPRDKAFLCSCQPQDGEPMRHKAWVEHVISAWRAALAELRGR